MSRTDTLLSKSSEQNVDTSRLGKSTALLRLLYLIGVQTVEILERFNFLG